MNIERAKEEIKNTVKAYLAKDEDENPLIPSVHQRPVLLIGPPGIGKTASSLQHSPTFLPAYYYLHRSFCYLYRSGLHASMHGRQLQTPLMQSTSVPDYSSVSLIYKIY
jgi:DNA polymerase III delta prime subunit